MDLLKVLSSFSDEDRVQILGQIKAGLTSIEGEKLLNLLDMLIVGHVPALGSEPGPLTELNAQRHLITQLKLIARSDVRSAHHARRDPAAGG